MVFFVDFGNNETIKIDELYLLDDVFIEEPCYAIKCRVDGLKACSPSKYDHTITEDIDSYAVDENADPKILNCKFVSYFEPYVVELRHNNTLFIDELSKMGHCQSELIFQCCAYF